MKAAICYEFGKPLVVEQVELDPPQAGEVKVRLAACAICHSDVHLIRGDWGGELPIVAGHEAAGVIAEVGAGVERVRPGDHVVVSGEEGVIKPEPRIYELLEERSGLSGAQLFFTDDKPENIAAAEARGWRGHVFTGPEGLARALRGAGLPV